MSDPRYIVAQVGARRRYAVPAILAAAGMLDRFYTDICGNVGLGRILSWGGAFSPKLARLAGRQVPTQVASHTRTFPLRTALHLCCNQLAPRDCTARYRSNVLWQVAVGRSAARKGFGEATHLFSMLGEFPTLVAAAKERGLCVVSEIYIVLAADEIVAKERSVFPSWEAEPGNFDSVRRELFTEDALLDKTDFFICPSEAVRDDLVLYRGVPRLRTAIIPYGIHSGWLSLTPQPRRGRVLFVGTADLRKGIHYLAMAADQLARRNSNLEFRVAGDVSSTITRQSICRHLNFLGRISRDRIHEEFQTADLFVLPSLAEGSAEVTYEALAAGVPVITTKSAGSVVRDGIEGRIVPERDERALASAIEELVEDRAQRNRMAVAARERAREFIWDRYAESLIGELQKVSV
jgi:glycosyltransferase involved in cell wall biosynthesis